jgi:hypothetical protein
VQIAATVAVSSFRRSATPDQTLSFRINRPGDLREQLRTGLVPHPRGRIGLETAVEHLATFLILGMLTNADHLGGFE